MVLTQLFAVLLNVGVHSQLYVQTSRAPIVGGMPNLIQFALGVIKA
jgi:hypothetical protein